MHTLQKASSTINLGKYIPIALWIIFVLLMYIPLFMDGGIILDDWGDIGANYECNSIFDYCFIERYRHAFIEVFANRPLAPLPIVFTTILFKTNFSWYLYFNTALLFASILITALVINRLVGQVSAMIFAFVATIPFISMPLVVSPINLTDSTLAYLFWSISFYLIYKYCETKSKVSYLTSYVLLVCGFFTYEVFLPLLVINALAPLVLNKESFQGHKWKYFWEFIAPLIIVLAIVFIWQKVIGPKYYVIYSRLNLSWGNILPGLLSWVNIFIDDIPSLFICSKNYLSAQIIFTSLFFACSIGISCKILGKIQYKFSQYRSLAYLLMCLICLVGTSMVLVLSGARDLMGGYGSRGLSSTWMAIAFLSSAVPFLIQSIKYPILKIVSTACAFGILFFSCLSFGIQRDNYIKSWDLQMHLIEDALQLISKSNIPKGALIFGNVPSRLENDYNNEIVFEAPWDFTVALSIFTNRLIAGGPVIDAKNREFHYLRISEGTWDIHGIQKTGFDNLWFYNYDPQEKKGSLERINSAHQLKSKLASLGFPFYLGNLGRTSDLKRNETIYFAHDWQNRDQFIKRGFSDRESWGVWSFGREAELALPLPIDGSRFLEIDVRAFVSKNHPMQRVEVLVDGGQKYQYALNDFDSNLIRIPIAASNSNSGRLTHLRFNFMDAISPKQLGIAPDDRELAIGFKSATFH
jgi:hypothetical protein